MYKMSGCVVSTYQKCPLVRGILFPNNIKNIYHALCHVPGPPGVVLLVDVTTDVGVLGGPGLDILGCPVLELVIPVGSKPNTIPPDVGVVGFEPFGVVGCPVFKDAKLTVNTPGVVAVTDFTGLAPGVVGVVGVVPPGVSTPGTVRTVSVDGFFMALMVCRICETLVQRRRPIPPNSFSYCSGESGGRRILSNTPGQCFYSDRKIRINIILPILYRGTPI